MVVPSTVNDQVVYAPRSIYTTENILLDLDDDSRLDIFGNVYVNGIKVPGAGGSSSYIDAMDKGILGNGTDETTAIQALLTTYSGKRIYFPPPSVSYMVSNSLIVGSNTEIFGVGYATKFDQTGNMKMLFNMLNKNSCIIRDLRGVYTGGKANGMGNANGGATFGTNSLVWTNGDHHKFMRLISEDFCCPIRIDNWNGSVRTSRPTNNLVQDVTIYRPNNGLLISGAMYSTFRGIKVFDVRDDFGQPPHAIYTTNEGSLTVPYMEGLHFEDIFCDGLDPVPGQGAGSSAFQFKGLLGGRIVNAESVDCPALMSIQMCSDVTVEGASGRNLTGGSSGGAFYTDLSNGPCDRISISDVVLRFVASPGIANNRAARIIGNDISVDGMDIYFPCDAGTPDALSLGTTINTSDYRLRNITVVNLNPAAVNAKPVGVLQITTAFGEIRTRGFTNNTVLSNSSSGIDIRINDSLLERYAGYSPAMLGKATEYWAAPLTRGTAALASGLIYTHSIFVPQDCTISRIGAEVTTIAAGSTISLGIYADNGAGDPGALVVDAGTIDGGVLGAAEKTISQLLVPGTYHLAALCQGGTPTMRSFTTTWSGRNSTLANATLGAARPGLNRGGIVGTALPSLAGILSISSGIPVIAVKFA